MANIHSQKKRILRSERERLENRHYTSAIRTYFRRLEAAVFHHAQADPWMSNLQHRGGGSVQKDDAMAHDLPHRAVGSVHARRTDA